MRTAYVTCPLCEATCGLSVELEGDTISSVRGDEQDVFSAGYICPKGASLKALHEDPDRLRQPMIKRAGGWEAASWDEAFEQPRHGCRCVRHLTLALATTSRCACLSSRNSPSLT